MASGPRENGGVTTTFLLDGQQVVLEKQGATTTASYTYGNSLLTRSGETMHFDGHGSLRTVTNASQGVLATGNWHAYGVSAGGTGSSMTPYQYGGTSRYRNDGDAGLLHIGARWYDPSIGRFASADSDLGDEVAPLSRNRYIYTEGDPVNHADRTGHGFGDWLRAAWRKVVTWVRGNPWKAVGGVSTGGFIVGALIRLFAYWASKKQEEYWQRDKEQWDRTYRGFDDWTEPQPAPGYPGPR